MYFKIQSGQPRITPNALKIKVLISLLNHRQDINKILV